MGEYRTIVAYPPWDHSDGTGAKFGIGDRVKRPFADGGGPRGTQPPYEHMSLKAIKALPVGGFAGKDAHLYLWVTNRFLRSVWDVAEAWGFRGVCVLTWCKRSPGFLGGGAFKSNTEFCLFARRGNLKALRRWDTRWFEMARTVGPPVREGEKRQQGHSAKPEAFLDIVEQVSPGPRLEMFARRGRLGWDYWGDESLGTAEMPEREARLAK
jgi:N6-adenosine-specific RNA methylase IME4